MGDGATATLFAPAQPGVAIAPPSRSVTIRGTEYPLVLPRLRDSRLHVAAVVITLHTLGQVGLGFHVSVPQILAAILTSALLQVAITFWQKRAFVWPASAMLTGSGIALILRVPSTPVGDHWTFHKWWLFSAISAFSLLTKFIVRRSGSHVFNPSNIGLVIAFIVLGSNVVEPLDFWWAPLSNPSMVIAYAVILIGGSLVARRLGLLVTVVSFWLVLATGMAINSAAGMCFTARWSFSPVCGSHLWLTIVTSPEIMIFTYFMITDPRTVPLGRVGRAMFGAIVGVVCVLFMAPQTTEFGAKVGLLAGLSVMTLARPLLERWVPAAGSDADHLRAYARRSLSTPVRATAVITTALLIIVGLSFAANSAQGLIAGEPEDLMGRMATRIDPSTFPDITVDSEVTDWNHELDVEGARAVVLTLAENLALESQALVDGDESLLEAVDHGDRLDTMRNRLSDAATSEPQVSTFSFDSVRVTLLVPFGRQDGLSLGMVVRGTATTNGRSSAFETMWAMRRATGDRWLIVAELPVPAES